MIVGLKLHKNSSGGKNIRLFLVDGSPNGIITAEIMNWTGHILFAPRSRIADLLVRPETGRTGVYLLIGASDDDARVPVYVGESDNVGTRLTAHARDVSKDFWERSVLITSKDQNLTKAHVRYLESRLIGIISGEGRAFLVNGTAPEVLFLPEAEVSDMEYFLEQLEVLLPVLGIDFATPTPKPSDGDTNALAGEVNARASTVQARPTLAGTESPVFQIAAKLSARAIEVDGQMVVLEGSDCREQEQPSLASNVRSYRKQLVEAGKIAPTSVPGILRFTQDVAFSSPSAAAQAVMGTSRNGRIDWQVEGSGETYAQWQERQIAQSLAAVSGTLGSS